MNGTGNLDDSFTAYPYYLNFLIQLNRISDSTVIEPKVEVNTGSSIVCLRHSAVKYKSRQYQHTYTV